MKLIVLDLNENRIKNVETFNTIRKAIIGKLDTLEFETFDTHLKKNYRILFKDLRQKWREYIISEITEIHDETGIIYSIYCENSIIELRDYFIEDRRIQSQTAQIALDRILENTNWTGLSDSIGVASKVFYRQSVYESINDLLELFSCEIETKISVLGNKVTKRELHLKKEIGNDQGKRFSYTKDLLSIERKIKDDIFTALFVYGKSQELTNEEGESTGGYSRRIDFSEINNGKAYVENVEATKIYGFNGKTKFGKIELDDIDDKKTLLAEAKKLLDYYSKPRITYIATVLDLKSYGFNMEGVSEGDKVVIRDRDLNISIKARITEIEENLDEDEDTKLTIGNFTELYGTSEYYLEKKIAKLTSKEAIYDNLDSMIKNGEVKAKIEKILEAINEEFINGTTNMSFDINRGLVLTDKKEEKDSTFIVEIGSVGIRFANSKLSNGEWEWRSAMTSDGISGESIVTNSITANKLASDVGQYLDLSSNVGIKQSVSNEVNNKLQDPLIQEQFKGEDGKDGIVDYAYLLENGYISYSDIPPDDTSRLWVDSESLPRVIRYYDENSSEWVSLDDQIVTQLTNLEQTINEFEFQFSSKTELQDLENNTSYKFSQINKYIRFIDGDIHISEEGNPFNLIISNDRISFMNADLELAYFKGDELYVDKLKAITQITVASAEIRMITNTVAGIGVIQGGA